MPRNPEEKESLRSKAFRPLSLLLLLIGFSAYMQSNEYTLQKELDLPFKEPITKGEYVLYGIAQALDLHSTYQATSYPCLEEGNPLLPKKPSLKDLIIFDTVHNYLILKYVDDKDSLALHTTLTFAVAYNNYKLVEQGC